MPFFDGWPDWFGEAVAGVVTGSAVYLYRSWRDAGEERRRRRAGIISQLEILARLLHASRRLFEIQQVKMNELLHLLENSHAEKIAGLPGYDAKFSACFPKMTVEERELHGLIRAYTEHSLLRVNEEVTVWLRKDEFFKTGAITCPGSDVLAQKLRDLEIHLLLWRAKFEYWIPGQPQHAVVYMDDEKQHGLGFPPETDQSVTDVVRSLRSLWFGKRRRIHVVTASNESEVSAVESGE